MIIRNPLQWLVLLLTLFISAAWMPQAAQAAAPQIDNLTVTPPNQFSPGTELTFTLEGTPRGKASLKVTGINRTIVLKEIAKGEYEADYTVSSKDRITASSTVRATLKVKNQSSVMTQRLGDGTAVAAAPAAPAPAAGAAIQQFSVTPIEKIEPGADLRFALTGTPGARASFTIDGVAKDVPMREVKSGQYEGSYTIRRLDNFPPNLTITAALESNGQVSRSRLAQPLVAGAKPPVIKNLTPRQGETVSGTPVLVSATFDDAGGVGIDVKTIRILVGGNDVTRNATVTPQFFSYRAELRPGSHQVDVTARDLSGNTVRQNWTFTVAAQPVAALPLQILSPANNAQVPAGAIEVRGRTAPDATVEVQVQAIAQLAGFVGLNQQIFSQNLRADANGNFGFSFQSPIPVPGARYEVTLRANKAEQNKEMKLVLFQQK